MGFLEDVARSIERAAGESFDPGAVRAGETNPGPAGRPTRPTRATPPHGGWNFTERMRGALGAAREEAARREHDQIGTEHLLLGLLRQEDGVSAAVLRDAGISPDDIRRRLDDVLVPGAPIPGQRHDLAYTALARHVLEFAMSEARELGQTHVSTAHLLLGLVREEHGIASRTLRDAGLTLERARAEVHRLFGESASPAADGESAAPSTPARSAPGGELAEDSPERLEARRIAHEVRWQPVRDALALADATGTPARLVREDDGTVTLVLGDDLLRVSVPAIEG